MRFDRTIKLVAGVGKPGVEGCWMSVDSFYAGENWTDCPECVCPVIRKLCIVINDALPTDESRGRIIGPRLFEPLGTVDAEAMLPRMWVLVDAAVRDFAAYSLGEVGLHAEAGSLRSLKPICDSATALAAAVAAWNAESAAWNAAWNAANAVRSAAMSAESAESAARSAMSAESAAWNAESAAWNASCTCAVRGASVREDFVVAHLLPVLDRMLPLGRCAPAERACKTEELEQLLCATVAGIDG